MESWLQSWQPRTNAFCFFPVHVSKILRLQRKSDARSYEVLHLSCKIISANLKIWCSKMQPLRNPWWTCLLYCACHAKSIFPDPLQMSHACHRFWKCHKTLTFCSLLAGCRIPGACHMKRRFDVQKWHEHAVICTCWLRNVLCATTACTFSTSQLPKVVRHWGVLCILILKLASRHNGVHCFNISTSSDPSVFDTLRHVLRAAKACTFSTSQLPKVNRAWCALCILTWKCASRLNGVHFFISHLARWLCTRRFSEPTFRPSVRSHKSLQKHSESRLFYFFTHLHLLSSDSFSSLIFFLLLFLSLTLPTSAFPSGHMVGSLTSKLPSTI